MNQDFNDRLNRIGAQRPSNSNPAPHSSQGIRKFWGFIWGVLFAGSTVLGNIYYDYVRAQDDPLLTGLHTTALIIFLVVPVFLLIGVLRRLLSSKFLARKGWGFYMGFGFGCICGLLSTQIMAFL